MPQYHPPSSFTRALRAFDPALRVRWSDKDVNWRIERRLTHGTWADPAFFADPEDRQTARDGYVLVLTCQKEQLDNRVFYTLWDGDIWRRGGAKKVGDQIFAGLDTLTAARRRRWSDYIETCARERYDYMNRVRTLPDNARHTGRDMSITLGV